MTRIDFYVNATDKARTAQSLCAKAAQRGLCTLLYADNAAFVDDLDRGLWLTPPTGFLPHVRCDHPLASRTALLIGTDPEPLAQADLLINLSDAEPAGFARFERLIEIVGQDEADKQRARQRWRAYQTRGYELKKVDL